MQSTNVIGGKGQQGLWIVESQTVLKQSDIKECLPYYLRRGDTLQAGSVALVIELRE